jgi:anti-sigma factor RsiW
MTCAHVREELGAYALDALEPAERAAVAAHLEQCAACRLEYERLAGLPALLVHAEGLEIPDPPVVIEERVLDAIARERGAVRHTRRHARLRRPGWTRGRALVAGALAGLALGAGVTALALRDDQAQVRTYALSLKGSGGASAKARLQPGQGGTEVHLWVRGLPSGSDTVYEVRCERPGWSASAGTFRADSRGRAFVVLTTAARIGEYETIRVVRRPDDTDVLTGSLN